jgi:hypothetical protein
MVGRTPRSAADPLVGPVLVAAKLLSGQLSKLRANVIGAADRGKTKHPKPK